MMRRSLAVSAVLALSFAVARADGPEVTSAAVSEGVAFEPGTPAFADVLAKAKTTGRPAFIDFSTTWCGWCKKLDKDVYTQPAVGEVMKGLVNVHVDAEKGEGVELAKRFGVS